MGLECVVGEGEHTVAFYAGKSLCAARDLKHGGDGVVRIGVGEIVGCTMDGIWDYLIFTSQFVPPRIMPLVGGRDDERQGH